MEVEMEAEVEVVSGSLLTHNPNRFYHRGNYQATGSVLPTPRILTSPSAGGYNSFPVTIRTSTNTNTNTEGKQ